MKVCKVIGKADSSIKHQGLSGIKLLIVQEMLKEGDFSGKVHLCADPMGAGTGEIVAVSMGARASAQYCGQDSVCDAVVVAILDHIFLNEKEIFSK